MGISDWPNRTDRIPARNFAILYIIWSVLWVVGSDYVMHLALHGPIIEWKIESYKGVTYVLVSGLILFLAVRERDRKHKRERVQTESMLKSLRQSGLIGVYEWRSDGTITDANRPMLDALGFTREELKAGKLTREAITPREYWQADELANRQLAATGKCALYKKEVTRKDGSRIQVLTGRARLADSTDRGIGYALDISEMNQLEAKQAQLQQQLLQSEKLNALGQLAGGIAHDFNNLLSIIIGYSSLTESKLGSADRLLRENTAQVLKAADTAKNLIRKLLAFSRKQVLNPELLNVNELITDLSRMLSRVLDERIKMELRLEQKVGNIEADRAQIEQVILNLVVNAREAMATGGTLILETFSSKLPDGAHPELSGEFEAIRVSDTGIGMDESIRLRIFEPFFTTKGDHGGTGLGLATVYGIVKQSGGYIEVESDIGHGSSFTVYLPRAHALKMVDKRDKVEEGPTTGFETILLIEDLNELREMVGSMLRAKGYKVLQARDGVEAISVATAHFGTIALILTDVIMPRLNGPEAVRQIRERRPDVKVIYITGYSDQSSESGEAGADSITVEKPIKPEALLMKIRELLDENKGGRSSINRKAN